MRIRMLLVLAMVLAGACAEPATTSSEESDGAVPQASESDVEPAPTSGVNVSVADSDLGMILTDGDGNTVYLLTTDGQGASTCYDDCETNWPVLKGPVTAGDGVDAALLGTTERKDGTVQATYNDWPLYYFAGDAQAGDLNGQGVGGVWYVLDEAGEPVKDGASDGARDY